MIRIELSRAWILCLYRLTFDWRPHSHGKDHADLLIEHRHELLNYLAQRLCHEKNNYTIKFTSLQALAFYQSWIGAPMLADDLGQVVIAYILQQINRQHENHKRMVRNVPGTIQEPGAGEHVVGGRR